MIITPGQARRPLHPLAETALAFCILYIPRMLVRIPAGLPPGTPGWYIALGAKLSAEAALLLFVIHKRHGLSAFFPADARPFPGLKDVAGGILVLFVLALAGALPLLAASVAGLRNPLLEIISGSGGKPSALLAPILFSSLAVGYSEELFFRVYAFGMLRKSGLSTKIAALCATLVFAGAHGGQGVVGILSALVLGAVFQLFWIRKRQFHAIAIGHALYDFAVLLVVAVFGASG